MTFSNGYNTFTMGYFELKLHKYILRTPETNIISCKKGHNRCALKDVILGYNGTVRVILPSVSAAALKGS